MDFLTFIPAERKQVIQLLHPQCSKNTDLRRRLREEMWSRISSSSIRKEVDDYVGGKSRYLSSDLGISRDEAILMSLLRAARISKVDYRAEAPTREIFDLETEWLFKRYDAAVIETDPNASLETLKSSLQETALAFTKLNAARINILASALTPIQNHTWL